MLTVFMEKCTLVSSLFTFSYTHNVEGGKGCTMHFLYRCPVSALDRQWLVCSGREKI